MANQLEVRRCGTRVRLEILVKPVCCRVMAQVPREVGTASRKLDALSRLFAGVLALRVFEDSRQTNNLEA